MIRGMNSHVPVSVVCAIVFPIFSFETTQKFLLPSATLPLTFCSRNLFLVIIITCVQNDRFCLDQLLLL